MPTKQYVYRIASCADIGTRDEQQDYINVIARDTEVLAFVCDGMGGLEAGRIASFTAGKVLEDEYSKHNFSESVPEFFLRCVDIMDESVHEIKIDAENGQAGTTVVATLLKDNLLYWLSVGDSRLYIFRNGEFVQATRDHNYFLAMNSTPSEYAPTTKDLSMGEALISFIGMGGVDIMDISNNPFALKEDDRLLLSTDGLFKSLSDEQIKVIIEQCEEPNTAAKMLLDKANAQASIRDNTSFVLIHVS